MKPSLMEALNLDKGDRPCRLQKEEILPYSRSLAFYRKTHSEISEMPILYFWENRIEARALQWGQLRKIAYSDPIFKEKYNSMLMFIVCSTMHRAHIVRQTALIILTES